MTDGITRTNPMNKTTETLIVGAGIIGLTTGLRLAREGMQVTLIDPADPGSGASYGNAGTIADYAALPVGHPGIFRQLPSLLFDHDSPLAIQRSAIVSVVPWLARFLLECRRSRFLANTAAITKLVADAAPRWKALTEDVDGKQLLQAKGCLYLYADEAAFKSGERDMRFRRTLGVTAEMLDADELTQLEPNLFQTTSGGAYFPDALFLSDPGATCAKIYQAFKDAGGRLIRDQVTGLKRQPSGPCVTLAGGEQMSASTVVLSAGAHAKKLAAQAGDFIPLISERGYHLEYNCDTPLLNRPACFTAGGFYLCPMAGRLRVAGTVELGNNSPRISTHRLDALDRGVRRFFPDLPAADKSWLGFRPSLPDSRPVISASKHGKDVIYAFGHGHIGMTLAPITADMVQAIITESEPPVPLAPYSVARF
jgi:glycine/D-amino acid oxidase-like deaminating enzyme